MHHFAVFGSHPRLSLAEFKAVKPEMTSIPMLCGSAAIFEDSNWNGAALMNLLGGTVKLGDIVREVPTDQLTARLLADIIQTTPRGDRAVFGLTIFGASTRGKEERLALDIKRVLKEASRSVRWVTSEGSEPLSPAAVAKMRLTTEGYDFVVLLQGKTAFIGLTTHVQDADAWGLRDYGRPVRDDENGMLPPKLARMMVNLAHVSDGATVLDPFCGSGTVLMEAALATKAIIISSDNDPKQIADTQTNLEWLFSKLILDRKTSNRFETFVSDARSIRSHLDGKKIDAVVTEGYLGPLLRGHETQTTLDKNAREITSLWHETLKELRPFMKETGRVVAVWPAFKTEHGMSRVDLTNELEPLGYHLINPLAGWDETNAPLLYNRAGQRVMRRIVVLEPIKNKA